MNIEHILLPDIGDFNGVEIIEVLINEGDAVELEQSLITLESDKASMEIPSPVAGIVKSIHVTLGDRVSQGDLIIDIQTAAPSNAPLTNHSEPSQPSQSTSPSAPKEDEIRYDVAVLGSGPGGYTAAFRAADLGLKVALIERYDVIGGVCLNVGCIPSKALLHMAEIVCETEEMADNGIQFGQPKLDLDKIRQFKNNVIGKLTGGLTALAKQRKVTIIRGYGQFLDANTIVVQGDTTTHVHFDHAIIAAGSRVTQLPQFPWDDERIIDSTGALEIKDIPNRLLVVGGGIIGMEMATVYESFGSDVTVAIRSDRLFGGEADKDIWKVLEKRMKKRLTFAYNTSIEAVDASGKTLKVTLNDGKETFEAEFDRILVATGRNPNGLLIDADKAGVFVDEKGFITVDHQMRTNVDHIFAIGDIVGQPMLAHKATHEGKVAAEVIAGQKASFNAMTIPSVAYTNPEVAWMGKTEAQLKAEGIEYTKGAFPWAASGRSLSINCNDGMTKAMFDKESGRILGAAIVGPNAGELIAEAVLALEMGACAEDIGLSIHPHPTLSETLCFAAEMAEGTITDLMPPKRR